MTFSSSAANLLYVFPFVGMLLSIAAGPLLAPQFWHHHYFKVSLGWTVLIIGMLLYGFGIDQTTGHFAHMLTHEYIPFILMIGALFTITGGIHIVVRTRSTALVNTTFLLVGALIASLIGTTGAAMLLIRPFIEMNKNRFYKTHLGVFFIFIVANIGGSLTPLGDPPLFLGYLRGVPFEWPLLHLFKPFVITMIPLLLIFFAFDALLMRRDNRRADHQRPILHDKNTPWISITGQTNILLLLFVVILVWLSGLWSDSPMIDFLGLSTANFLRNLGLVVLMALSLLFTSGAVRNYNHFTWEPFREVAEVFIGIFATLIPVATMLHQGLNGPFSGLIALANPNGIPNNMVYFWLTGILSGVLDNAPTYLVFYNMLEGIAGGSVSAVLSGYQQPLIAISAGSVFMGALTYIGNAPNFMVRSIAEKKSVHMPSFFGYMAWSIGILIPVFILLGWVIF